MLWSNDFISTYRSNFDGRRNINLFWLMALKSIKILYELFIYEKGEIQNVKHLLNLKKTDF